MASLTPTQLLIFLLQFIVLLAVARGLGEIAARLGQPVVIGELLAGVVIGPSCLGFFAPSLYAHLFPSQGIQPLLMQIIAELGVILLLLLSGMEINLALVQRKAKSAVSIASAGIVIPFLAGYALAALLPGTLMAHGGTRSVFVLFVATAMSISAIPVIVKILLDMDLMHRDVGQIIVAAGALNDTAGWFLLAFVTGIASASQSASLGSIAISILGTLAFAVLLFTVGYRLIRLIITWVDNHLKSDWATMTTVMLIALGGSAITQAFHVEAFIGAFLTGIQLGRVPRVNQGIRAHLEALTLAVFAPVFFSIAGLNVNVVQILTPALLLAALAVIVVACVGKFAGTYAGARLAGISHWSAVSLGSGMNARGAVEIIVATVGLRLQILTVPMYSIIVLMAVVTSLMAPPLLRWSLKRTPPDPEEEARLKREDFEAQSFLYSLRRVLVPMRDRRIARVATEFVGHLAGGREVEADALHIGVEGLPAEERPRTVVREQQPKGLARVLAAGGQPSVPVARLLASRQPDAPAESSPTGVIWTTRDIEPVPDVVSAIFGEVQRGYDLLALVTHAEPSPPYLLGPVADAVVRDAPCNVIVLRMPEWQDQFGAIRRVLVPTTGAPATLRAAEVALGVAKSAHAEVVALHVIDRYPTASPFSESSREGPASLERAQERGWHATTRIAQLGEALDVPVTRRVLTRIGVPVSDTIAEYARGHHCDLVFLRGERRAAGDTLYGGELLERLLGSITGPVAVLFDAP